MRRSVHTAADNEESAATVRAWHGREMVIVVVTRPSTSSSSSSPAFPPHPPPQRRSVTTAALRPIFQFAPRDPALPLSTPRPGPDQTNHRESRELAKIHTLSIRAEDEDQDVFPGAEKELFCSGSDSSAFPLLVVLVVAVNGTLERSKPSESVAATVARKNVQIIS